MSREMIEKALARAAGKKITRRAFAGALGAAAVMPFRLVADAGRPLLKIGVITDTHVGKTKESCARVKLAYELFREQSPDLIVNVGDIADLYYPTGYVAYRECVEEAYAGVPAEKRPKELFVYAGHDVLFYKPGVRLHVESGPEVAANVKRLLKIPNDLFAEGEVNGFPYVVVPQFGYFAKSSKADEERFEKMVADAVRSHPGKPVFVFTHVPARGTVRRGNGWESTRRILNPYPQVVCFTGHVHGSLLEERSIWQGEYTSVSAGCLQNWGPSLPGSTPPRMQNYGALVVDVFSDRILFHRFDVRDRKEPGKPWCVPWPFDPATAPYRPAVRRTSVPAPNFAGNEEIKIEPDAKPFRNLAFSFPCVPSDPHPFAYRIELSRKGKDGAWAAFARRDLFGEFWQREFERPAAQVQTFDASYFEEGREYLIKVVPRTSFGLEGKGIEKVFTAPAPEKAGETVWETDNAMDDCPFRAGFGGRKLVAKDGFYQLDVGDATLEFPKNVWDGPAKTRFRFTLDMQTIQDIDSRAPWSIVLRTPQRRSKAHGALRTPPGDSGPLRYMAEFAKPNGDFPGVLFLRGTEGGRVRFMHVKIERLPPEKGRKKKSRKAEEEL